jgi:thiol-disulfide isomerase/thioredoxin
MQIAEFRIRHSAFRIARVRREVANQGGEVKKLLVLVFIALIPLSLQASQRVMVFEDITATWCQYCPGAARGIDELDARAFDSVVCIAYHASNSGDPYYNADAATRASYYHLTGYPTVRLDGYDSVVGGVHTGTMYPTYREMFDARRSVASPLEIEASTTYDSSSRTGELTAVLKNTTGSAVSGQLQVAVVENHIYYPWQGMDSLQFVEREMLPNASGEAVTIPASDSLVKTRDFTLTSGWVAGNCEIVVFVQNNTTKEILQGARTGVIMQPKLVFAGYQSAFPEPGGDVNLTIGLLNIGTGVGQGLSATLTTGDSYVTVTTGTAAFNDIAVAGEAFSNTPYQIHVAGSCPNPHLATMNLQITGSNGYSSTTSFPLNITLNPGFYDSMEAGVNGWTHNGILDGWHQSSYRSSSPTHSWYSGQESNHQYTVENDARLMTPYFTVTSGAQMSFQHYYATEAGYDFCLVEIDNGSGRWQGLASYNGSGTTWTPQSFDLSAWAGQTVQIRFRFISDGSVVAEGWYVDDFWCTPVLGVTERPNLTALRLNPDRNPVTGSTAISYQLPPGIKASLAIYDAQGCLVRDLSAGLTGTGSAVWNLRDLQGCRVAAGTYFARLNANASCATSRIVVVR